MLNSHKRLLAISADRCDCYLARRGALVFEAGFAAGEAADFNAFVNARRKSLFVVMADQIEEDFRQETLPFLRGGQRRQLISRRAGQTYRDTPYHTSVSLGREAQGRRDERVLLMALTNAPTMNLWLTPLSSAGVRVAGVHSPPVATPALLKLIARLTGATPPRLLMVTLNRAGVRQTFVDGGVARFSRLSAIGTSLAGDPTEIAAGCLAEVVKTQQYLVSLRLAPRDAPMPALILTPPGQEAAWRAAGGLPDSLECSFVNLDRARHAAGLNHVEGGEADASMFADSLWLHVIARQRPASDFAPNWLHETYRTWQARTRLVGAGAAICIAGLAAGAYQLAQARELGLQASGLAAVSRRNEAAYQGIKLAFPRLPAAPEQIKASVLAFEAQARQSTIPTGLLAEIGDALIRAPDFTLERLDWFLAATPDDAPDAPARAAPPAGAGEPKPERYEIAVLTGVVSAGEAGDPRREIEIAARTAATLKSVRGATVTVTRTPVDLAATATVTGGETTQARLAGPPGEVVIRVVRKVGR